MVVRNTGNPEPFSPEKTSGFTAGGGNGKRIQFQFS